MLGTYRYLLALMVVFGHLGAVANAGAKAVFGFYLISGYLMTLVLNRTYGFSARGASRYLANRALRIYPPYWLVAALTFLFVTWQPEFAPSVKPELTLPASASDWLKNVFIFGMGHDDPVRWIPPTWSLYAELFFYVAMALGLARGRRTAIVWLGASVAYAIYMAWAGFSFQERYYPIPAASLPFSLGAVMYHFDLRFRNTPLPWAVAALAVFLFNGLFTNALWPDPRFEGFYASLAVAFVAQAALLGVVRQRVPEFVRRVDSFLGDLAYPIFLVHFLVKSVVALGFSTAGYEAWGAAPFLVALPLVHLFALAVHRTVERPVAVYRDRIRQPDASAAEPVAVRTVGG